MKKLRQKKQNFRAYSLLEVLATLAIVSILIVMLSNILFVSLDISRKAFARSQVREEQNNILTKIEKDFRNASYVGTCEGTGQGASCEIGLDKVYFWTTCDRGEGTLYVCKKDATKTAILDGMSTNVKLNFLSFEKGIEDAQGRKTVVITMSVGSVDSNVGVDNQVRQIVVSTRNYSIN